MSSAIEDELLSINAIYDTDTLLQASPLSDIYLLKIPSTNITLRLSFPPTYPDDPPNILGPESSGAELKRGSASEVAALARELLHECFAPGIPSIFELLEQIANRLAEAGHWTAQEDPEADEQAAGPNDDIEAGEEAMQEYGEPVWAVSEVISEKKSVFIARAARVSSPEQARFYLQHLITTDKKVARATHNMTAWRMRQDDSGVVYQDCDDDGEAAAGGRLLHLLQIMNIWNVMVVASRFYGGVKLGPDRFRLINSVARDALTNAGFTRDAGS